MLDHLARELEQLEGKGRIRTLPPLSAREGCYVELNGKRCLNLSSNDYLGLAADSELQKKFYDQLSDETQGELFGTGSVSSRLLTGNSPQFEQLEEVLKESYRQEAALLFNSGYHANIGILPAITSKKDLILADKLNHASIIDGLKLSQAVFKRYNHCDFDHLRWQLDKYRNDFENLIIVSESVFSMDGDTVDLPALVELKNEFNGLLYLDEAHGTGLYGRRGLGVAEREDLLDQVDILIGTFGKALASIGAYVICPEVIKKYLLNKSRSLIFTTALPPVVGAWNLFAFREMMGMYSRRERLQMLSEKLRKSFIENGLETRGDTNIIPVIIGEDQRTEHIASQLQQDGFLLLPIRPPTVPEGTSRLRFSLTANMNWEQLQPVTDVVVSRM